MLWLVTQKREEFLVPNIEILFLQPNHSYKKYRHHEDKEDPDPSTDTIWHFLEDPERTGLSGQPNRATREGKGRGFKTLWTF